MLNFYGSTGCVNIPPNLTINRNGAAIMAGNSNSPEQRICEACGEKYSRRRDVSRRQFERSRACSRACAFALGRAARQWPSQEEMFWSKVDKRPGLGPDGQCWEWTGYKDRFGYGRLNSRHFDTKIAHRVSYLMNVGLIAEALDVRHRCDNPACVRPDHLELGTDRENTDDKVQRGRQRGPRGERAPSNKLAQTQVVAIHDDPRRQSVIASEYGIAQCTVSAIKRGRIWKHLWAKHGAER